MVYTKDTDKEDLSTQSRKGAKTPSRHGRQKTQNCDRKYVSRGRIEKNVVFDEPKKGTICGYAGLTTTSPRQGKRA